MPSSSTSPVLPMLLAPRRSQTDWEARQDKAGEEIETAVRETPGAVLPDREWFEKAKLAVFSSEERRIMIRLDEDMVEHFEQGGPGYPNWDRSNRRGHWAVSLGPGLLPVDTGPILLPGGSALDRLNTWQRSRRQGGPMRTASPTRGKDLPARPSALPPLPVAPGGQRRRDRQG